MSEIKTRPAAERDIPLILNFIKQLAEYERMSDQVVATGELLREWLFQRQVAKVIFALDEEGREVGFALYFHNYSTFLGRAGIYLEDLFVEPESRGRGYGLALMRELARRARELGCGRMEWSCLDWNTPSADFYRSIGARPNEGWTVFRMTAPEISALADREI